MDAQAEVVADVDLRSLGLLTAIGDKGSISAAAKALGLTQQAASARIRQLEREVGIPLLQRGARGSSLTAEGAIAAEWAADVVEAAQRFAIGVAALRDRQEPVMVAASLTIAEYLLPGWLLAAQNHGAELTDLTVTATNSSRVIELVASGAHQLGFIESPQDIGDLTAVTVARDELVAVVAPTHPWAKRASIPLTVLAETPLITRESGSGTRLLLERTIHEAGHTVAPPLLELPTTAAIRTVVASGAGPAVLSILAVRDDITAGRLVRVTVRDARLIRELRAIHAGTTPAAPSLRALLDIARRGHSTA
ncbi:LysR family transcriptional regulator [uncultured Leifsonia sp.]|uniref:LysR family transcriptional regulator n=1 Tax=uncultured Leifsonia sp. TaxID=340359 RepID=UPI0028D38884|nr:LysR family transcriptional regulator [uncultured Leifsonia sp.]